MLLEVKIADTIMGREIGTGSEHGAFSGVLVMWFYDVGTGSMTVLCFWTLIYSYDICSFLFLYYTSIKNIFKRHKPTRTKITKFGELESRWWVANDVAELRKLNFSLAEVKFKRQLGLRGRIPKRPKNSQHKVPLETYKNRRNGYKSI